MVTRDETRALGALKQVADAHGHPLVIVGAGARLLLFDEEYGIRGRSTTDWDLAVRLQRWEQYSDFLAVLCGDGAFRAVSDQKLLHVATATQIDLIPFGDLATDDGEIMWPSRRPMSVLGLLESMRAAVVVDIGGHPIDVAPVPCFVGLKLIAHRDRGAVRDLQDVLFVLDNASNCMLGDRFFEVLEHETALEFDEVGPRVLGEALAGAFFAPARDRVVSHLLHLVGLGDAGPLARLVTPAHDDWDARFVDICRKLNALRAGIVALS